LGRIDCVLSTHNCQSAMILRFLIPAIRQFAISTSCRLNDAHPGCKWFSVDGIPVLYAECGYAGFDRFGVGCDPIFFVFTFLSLHDGFKFMGFFVLPKRGAIRPMGLSFDCCSVSCMLNYKSIGFPLREAL